MGTLHIICIAYPVPKDYNLTMKFDVIITKIGSAKAKNIIARHIAHDPSISLQKALSMIESLPIIYLSGVSQDEALQQIRQLEKIQVSAKLVELQSSPLHQVKATPFVPAHDAIPQEIPPTQPAGVIQKSIPPAAIPSISTSPAVANGMKKKFIILSILCAAIAGTAVVFFTPREKFDWVRVFFLEDSKNGFAQGPGASSQHEVKTKAGAQSLHSTNDVIHNASGLSAPDTALPDTDNILTAHFNDSMIKDTQKIRLSESFADSAQKAIDLIKAMSFYKFAVAFNKQNKNAWLGLRNIYTIAHFSDEAKKTENQMKRMFGDDVFSLQKIVEPYGTMQSALQTEAGVFRLEYQSKTVDDNVVNEAFALAQTLRLQCNCKAISLYIHTASENGTLVYIPSGDVPASLDDFKKAAKITRVH